MAPRKHARALHQRREPSEVRAHREQVQLWLESCGWFASDGGMRHANLNGAKWPWPLTMSAQLQNEADEGRQGLVYGMLRGAG